MNKETQLNEWSNFTAKQLEVIKKKQGDYANDDVLSNFKTAAANAGIKEEQQVLSLIATKVARLGNLFNGKEPNFESIEDSVLDLANYAFLLHCVLKDKNKNTIHIKGWNVSDKGPQQQAPSYYETETDRPSKKISDFPDTIGYSNPNFTTDYKEYLDRLSQKRKINGQENGY
jgi:hypothetical protein